MQPGYSISGFLDSPQSQPPTACELDKGKKKKAQNLVISCSSKFDFGKSGLAELFEKLGCDGNYEFK